MKIQWYLNRGIATWTTNTHIFEWDCLEDLFTRGYLRDCCMNGRCCFPFKDVLFDYDEDFQKFKEYAVKNDEVIETVVPKLSSHL